MLYPIKFKPIYKEKIWGGNKLQSFLNKDVNNTNIGESWEISANQNNISIVQNGFLSGNTIEELIEVYMGDLVGEKIYQKFGIEFPLLIKFIHANDDLSVQVHPDDAAAKKRHKAYGKTEMWYIIDAEKDSKITLDFKSDVDKSIYLKALDTLNLTQTLKKETANKGDAFFIPAGTIHSIGSGILLAEIQQTSDITYRIFDWNRTDKNGKQRELHTKLALDVINFDPKNNLRLNSETEINKLHNLISCKYFTVNKFNFDEEFEIDYNIIDSFVVYMCTAGEFKIKYGEEAIYMKKGETVLIPAELKNFIIVPIPEAEILEIYIDN